MLEDDKKGDLFGLNLGLVAIKAVRSGRVANGTGGGASEAMSFRLWPLEGATGDSFFSTCLLTPAKDDCRILLISSAEGTGGSFLNVCPLLVPFAD